ncbi:MAG: HTH domain-containing protein, partial [Halomonas sp.]
MTIGNLMRLLSDGEVHSGEQLGETLGISRAAVWKQLKK